jgi:hypothetical protein
MSMSSGLAAGIASSFVLAMPESNTSICRVNATYLLQEPVCPPIRLRFARLRRPSSEHTDVQPQCVVSGWCEQPPISVRHTIASRPAEAVREAEILVIIESADPFDRHAPSASADGLGRPAAADGESLDLAGFTRIVKQRGAVRPRACVL